MTTISGEQALRDGWDDLLARHPMFDAISDEDRAHLLNDAVSSKHVIDAGITILKQDTVGDSLFLVCEGAVSVMLRGADGDPIELHRAEAGEVLGEMAVFGHRLRTASLVTATPCKLLEISGDEFRKLMDRHSKVALYLLAKLSDRMRETHERLVARQMRDVSSEVEELRHKLDGIEASTSAKLSATETMFEQTNKRASEVIASTDRARARTQWMITAAGTLLGLMGIFGVTRLVDQFDQIEETRKTAQKVLEDARGEIQSQLDEVTGFREKAREQLDGIETAEVELEELRNAFNLTLTKFNLALLKQKVDYQTLENGELSRETETYSLDVLQEAVEDGEQLADFFQVFLRSIPNADTAELGSYRRFFTGLLDRQQVIENRKTQAAIRFMIAICAVFQNDDAAAQLQQEEIDRIFDRPDIQAAPIFDSPRDAEAWADILLIDLDAEDWQRDTLNALLSAYLRAPTAE